MSNIAHFRPERLPVPRVFFADNVQQFKPHRGGRKATGLCSFHPDRNPSLSMDLDRGLWFCWVCNMGGDMIRFVQERDHCSFPEACRQLGCWEERSGKRAKKIKKAVVGVDLIMDYTIDGVSYRSRVRDDCRTWAELLRRIFHRASDRVVELWRGALEAFEEEAETQWLILATSWELLALEVGR